MTDKELLQQFQNDIRLGVRYRTLYGQSQMWRIYKTMYRGFWNKEVLPVAIIYAIGRSIIPQVYFRNPAVHVKAEKPGYTPHARIVEKIDKNLIKETGLKQQLKSAVLDCYLAGRGPGILGYDSEYGLKPSFELGDEGSSDSSLTSFGSKGERIEYSANVKPGMPWYLRCNPEDYVVPWGLYTEADMPWYAYRKMRRLRDVKEDPKYKNTSDLKGVFRSRLDGTSMEGITQADYMGEDSEAEWVEIWTRHDQRTGRVYNFTLDHDKFLRDDIDYLQIEGLNTRVLGFNEDPDFFWWPSDCRYLEAHQYEMNDVRTMAKKHRRAGLLKLLYDSNIKDSEITKLFDGEVKSAVKIDVGTSGDIRKAIALFQSHVPPDLAGEAAQLREDIREIIGFSRNQSGAFEAPSGRRTAHEAEIVKAASMIRVSERRDILADHLESIVRSYNQMIFTFWKEQKVVDLIGPSGSRLWIKFTGEQIKSELTYSINPEEAVPEDRATRKAEALEYLTVALKVPGLNVRYLLENYAAEFGNLDPALLFPQSEGAGRSPERAMDFNDYIQQNPVQGMSYPLQFGTGETMPVGG